jgi:hypothetical protein
LSVVAGVATSSGNVYGKYVHGSGGVTAKVVSAEIMAAKAVTAQVVTAMVVTAIVEAAMGVEVFICTAAFTASSSGLGTLECGVPSLPDGH